MGLAVSGSGEAGGEDGGQVQLCESGGLGEASAEGSGEQAGPGMPVENRETGNRGRSQKMFSCRRHASAKPH